MARRREVVGQLAIPLPPEMLVRSAAWQRRRDQREAYRAMFAERRTHGLRLRHVYKQIRLDTDEALRELGLMPPLPKHRASARITTTLPGTRGSQRQGGQRGRHADKHPAAASPTPQVPTTPSRRTPAFPGR